MVKNSGKKICPQCNYLGKDTDSSCPYCGIDLISICPHCGAPIRVAFAEYCYSCGVRFKDLVEKKSIKQKEVMHEDNKTKKPGERE